MLLSKSFLLIVELKMESLNNQQCIFRGKFHALFNKTAEMQAQEAFVNPITDLRRAEIGYS